jgi:hypothetical protein
VNHWAWTNVTLPAATELCIRVMVTSKTPIDILIGTPVCHFFFLFTFWSWQQSMREGFEGLFIVAWLDRHNTVVGYTTVLCPSIKCMLCYLEHSWTVGGTSDQVLHHSSSSLAMRRNLSWIYCVHLSLGIWCQNYLKLFMWMCLVWSKWRLTLGWHKKEERVAYLTTVFCTDWQGLYFVFLTIYINVSWRAVAFCYRLYNWNWNCYWGVPALFKIMQLFIYYFNQHVSCYFVHEASVLCTWPISHALWAPTFYMVQLLKTAACHKFSHFWKAVLFLVGCSTVCV